MGDAVKFAIAILMLFLSMVSFYIAFHPNAVTLTSGGNPVDDIFTSLMSDFNKGASTPTSVPQGNAGA